MDLSIQPYLEISAGERPGGVALRDCLTENYDRLYRRLLHHLGCPDLAGDALHDAWLRLGEATMTVQSPEAYVYRVACNVAIDMLRSNRLRLHDGEAGFELEHIADTAPGPELIAEARSEAHAVERAMQQLPHRHRSVLMALRIDDMTRHDVAALHGISLRRVDAMLRQALDHCAGKGDFPGRLRSRAAMATSNSTPSPIRRP